MNLPEAIEETGGVVEDEGGGGVDLTEVTGRVVR